MWDVEMARMFRERENKDAIGNILGKVVSDTPLKISILNGAAILEKEELYIPTSFANLEVGDEILLIPDFSESVFFIINRFRKVAD